MLQRVSAIPNGLILSKTTNQLVFDPMVGGEQFGNCVWAEWTTVDDDVSVIEHCRPLNHREIARLCDLHVTHMYWWCKVAGGAVLFAQAYAPPITGERLLYPGEVSRSKSMIALPGSNKNALV